MNEPIIKFGKLSEGKIFTATLCGEKQIFFRFWRGIVSMDTGETWRGKHVIFDVECKEYPNANLIRHNVKSFLKTIISPNEIPTGMIFTGKIVDYQESIFFKSATCIIALDSCDSWSLFAPDIEDYQEYPDAELILD